MRPTEYRPVFGLRELRHLAAPAGVSMGIVAVTWVFWYTYKTMSLAR